MSDYRIELDVYHGPLDLLLYLIRREEIDIHDIPIARITAQYCAHVDTLKTIDPDLAGEFLVMAATLMEIKTRMLLPQAETDDEGTEIFDPRAELVRQLLEYKAFKDAAGDLRSAADEAALRYPRRPGSPDEAEEGKDLEDVQIWDLVEAFNVLMVATGQAAREVELIYDDTPVELHAEDILDRLRRDGNLTFREIFAGRTRRTELIGLFLALLELIRRRAVRAEQEKAFGEIYIYVHTDPPAPASEAPPADAPGEAPGDETPEQAPGADG